MAAALTEYWALPSCSSTNSVGLMQAGHSSSCRFGVHTSLSGCSGSLHDTRLCTASCLCYTQSFLQRWACASFHSRLSCRPEAGQTELLGKVDQAASLHLCPEQAAAAGYVLPVMVKELSGTNQLWCSESLAASAMPAPAPAAAHALPCRLSC